MWYDRTSDIIEAALILKLVTKAWAFYTLWNEKFQWKEKLCKYLEWDEKARSAVEKQIQEKIKDMRLWKKVLDDEALDNMGAILEEETQSIDE